LEFPSASDPQYKTIMKWPLLPGTVWSSKINGQKFVFEITGTDNKISVAAGDFMGCLKIKSYVEGASGVRNDYFAPDVGLILTTLSSKNEEKRNTELLSYKLAEWPDFETEGNHP